MKDKFDLILQVPINLIKAAAEIESWFSMQNIKDWKVGNCCNREISEEKLLAFGKCIQKVLEYIILIKFYIEQSQPKIALDRIKFIEEALDNLSPYLNKIAIKGIKKEELES
jgi:hypothetical protein